MDPTVKAAGELNAIFDRLGVLCKVCVTNEEGKHVKATADLEEGCALFEELPVVSWSSPSLLALSTPFCFQCLRLRSHQLLTAVSDSETPPVTACAPLPSDHSAAALPKSWSQCAQCTSYFCSPECQQASARVHCLLCSCLAVVRRSRCDRKGSSGPEVLTATAADLTSSATSSLMSSSASSEITLEALARCVAWVIHRLSYVIEQQQLTHEVLQADYVLQQQQAGSSATGAVWSTASLNYQLFIQVVTPFSRLISPPDNVEFDGVSLGSWMAKLRFLLTDRCVELLLLASGASSCVVQRPTMAFSEHHQQQAVPVPAPALLWAEALVQVLLSADTLRTLVGQMVLNAHAVTDYVSPLGGGSSAGAFDWVLKGAGLYSLLACFNHSCVPNAAVSAVDGAHGIVLKTTRPVRAGEPLTITYIPLNTGASTRAERQRQLRNYFFTCHCPICAVEEEAATTESSNAV